MRNPCLAAAQLSLFVCPAFASSAAQPASETPEGVERQALTQNYAAARNAALASMPDEEKAWPLLIEAARVAVSWEEFGAPDTAPWRLSPSEESWPEALAWLDANSRTLELARVASGRPVLGNPWLDGIEPQYARAKGIGAQPAIEDFPLHRLVLSHARDVRTYAAMLSADAWRSLDRGTTGQAIANIRAIVGWAGLMWNEPTTLEQLVALAIYQLAVDWVLEATARDSAAFDERQLASLQSALLGFAEGPDIAPGLRFERLAVEDSLRRWYVDDEAGVARLSREGVAALLAIHEGWQNEGASPDAEMIDDAECEFAAAATRRQNIERLNTCERRFDEAKQLRYHSGGVPAFTSLERFQAGEPDRFPWIAVSGMAVTMAYVSAEHVAQLRTAAMIILSIERHRRRHDAYPASLDTMDSDLLMPKAVDRHSGERIKYRLVDCRPLLYSVGTDRDDDGGRPPTTGRGNLDAAIWRADPGPGEPPLPDGDWILFPPQ